MKISVLIPAYHAAATIRRALLSVQAQAHRDWEIIVVEDGSRDGTEEIVAQLARVENRPMRYENPGHNLGVAATRNQLLALATGPVAFLDADDWWSDGHLTAGCRQLAAGADVVATGVRTFDLVSQQVLQDVRPPAALAENPVGALFAESVIITSSSVLLSREIITETGAFDRSFSVGEDRDYWLRAAVAGARFAVEPGLTCHYAKHERSTMSRTQLVATQTVHFYEKYFELAAIPRAQRRRRLAHSLLNEGRLLRSAHAHASVRQLWRAWCLAPYNLVAAAHLVLSGGQAALR